MSRQAEFDSGALRIEHQGPSPLDYRQSAYVHPDRMAVIDPSAGGPAPAEFGFAERRTKVWTNPETGRSLKKPRELVEPPAAPGTVAFVDYSHPRSPDELHINYMRTRNDQRGQGHAARLLRHLISQHEGGYVDFGKMMSPESHHLQKKMAEEFPEKNIRGKKYY